MFGIGAGEFVLILIVGLIVFGPSQLPSVGRSLGKALREFNKARSALSTALADIQAEPEERQPKKAEKVEPVKNEPVEQKNVAPKPITTVDLNEMINSNPINTSDGIKISTAPAELPVEKVVLSKTDAVKES